MFRVINTFLKNSEFDYTLKLITIIHMNHKRKTRLHKHTNAITFEGPNAWLNYTFAIPDQKLTIRIPFFKYK